LAAGILVITSFQILLPVVPTLLERNGPHGAAGAGIATLFVFMVGGELVSPVLQSRWSAIELLIAGSLLLGIPSLVYAVPYANDAWLLAATAFRGLGMGVTVVVLVVLATELVPSSRRGSAFGHLGLVMGIPAVVAPSIGVWLVGNGRDKIAATTGFLAAVMTALLALALRTPSAGRGNTGVDLFAQLRRPGLRAVFVSFGLASCAYGGIFTFVPVALPKSGMASALVFFLAFGSCRAVSRWLSGHLGDRYSAFRLLAIGLALSVGGLAIFAGRPEPAFVLIGAGAYGFGNGAAQTGAYLLMIMRGASTEHFAVSALWNSAMDIGSGLGGAMIGMAAAFYGYPIAFWLIPVAGVASLSVLALNNRRPQPAPAPSTI
jgi:predicted MFS family arabinose efflux permease